MFMILLDDLVLRVEVEDVSQGLVWGIVSIQ